MSYLAKTPEGLLPCPFCGGEGSAYQVLDYPEKIGPRFSVICNGCGASVTTIFQSEWAAIEAWNRRAERTCRAVRVPGVDDKRGDKRSWPVCSECGGAVRANDRFCPNCGARIAEEEE